MKIFTFILAFISIVQVVSAQEIPKERPLEERSLVKEPDEILKSRLGNQGKSLINKSNYLVMDNVLFGVRHRWYIGDKLKLKEKGRAKKFQGIIESITDSSLIFVEYNDIMLRYDVDTIQLKNIRTIFVRRSVPLLSALSKLLPAYTIVSLIGKSVKAVQTDSWYPYKDISTIEYVAYSGGVLGFMLSRQRFRINSYRPLKVIKGS